MSTSARASFPSALTRGLPERYELKRHLATGGMAAVWCAEDRVLGRPVAIKVLSERYAHDEQAIRRFKREARAAARASAHPHVVTIYDVGDLEDETAPGEPGGAFIVMEHLAGGTVADALRHNAVTPAEARRWLREAAQALDHAHARGIVHRDIKPANFLLDRNRSLHVADFGIARLASEETITSAGDLFGTAAYLAPEQALGHDATPASDRYALAVAAYELLTGGRPFTAQNFAAQARQHIDDTPPPASSRNPELPRAVDAVLERGMAKDPADRYPSSVAFVAALDQALAQGPAADPTPTARTRPLVAAAAATVVTPPRRANGARGSRTPIPAPAPAPRRARPDPAPAAGRPADRHRGLALLALAAVIAVVAFAIASLGSSGTGTPASSRRAAAGTTTHRTSHRTATRHHAAATTTSHASTAASSTSAASPPASSAAVSSAPAAAGSPSAQDLQYLGHQELLAGNYPAAIAADRRALAAASPSSLTYAYALYDLGVALLKSGNPQAAIPVLRQRLQIPNQTATVQATLDQALRAAGQAPAPSAGSTGGTDLPPGLAKKHGPHGPHGA
ncbi:MAG TPA: serine/threonine-protein kinase [Solirubrobacteraceae bacterium]|nr:serine/threonine-protein kinase [Solirubrobacteraceae bacterium]